MRKMIRMSKPTYVWAAAGLLALAMGVLAWSASVEAEGVNPEKVQAPTPAEAAPVTANVVADTGEHIVIDYSFGGFAQHAVDIGTEQYLEITLSEEGQMKELVGAPELPHVCRSIIIPDDAAMAVRLLESKYYDIEDVDVAPSKGFIPRTVNPADVPYTFGEAYETDAFYPAEVVTLRQPYILRDYRGVVVKLHPFQYNPVARTLRVYTSATVEVSQTGPGQVNVLDRTLRGGEISLAFHQIYRNHFLNYASETRYTPLDETGDLLIICYDSWLSNIQPLVDHKNAIGLTTTAVGVSTIGNYVTAIQSYIQNAYDTGDLAFVLLVGDVAQIATPFASGGAADPTYALVAGGDSYPDIMVGRFSAQTAAQVDTQVLRTTEYETMPATQQAWFKRGTGIASNQGPGHNGEYDNQHMDLIRNDLLAYGYTLVDQIYDPTGTDTQVTNALNAGRGIVNYCGHGSATAWSSTGFNNADVDNLANDNMLPFIFSVACNNGEFDTYSTCFAEAWLRATNGSEPTGAVAMYASSIVQSWSPPMDAQDEFVDLLVAEQYFSFGALCFAGSCKMIDINGAGGVSMFNTWHLFGDPSVRVLAGGATCNDGIQNQGEDRIDCGGPCPPCDCLSDGECTDGLFCTGTEACDAYGHCQGGSDPCPGQYCDEAGDVCVECLENAHCNDGLFCNGAETCVSGACQPGTDPCPGQGCDEVNNVCTACDDDGTCEPGEDCHNCPNDCISGEGGAVCGNGLCEAGDGEDCRNCSADCNGKTTGSPSGRFCCGATEGCGDSRCNDSGWTCTTTPQGEPYCCGDGVCEGAEDVLNCAVDCGCTGPEDCDDGNQCTTDACVDGVCQYAPVADDTPCTGGICCDGICDAPVCSVSADCNDGQACTADTCYDGDTCAAYCDSEWPACGLADGCCGPSCAPETDPDCACVPKGDPCTLDSECCSNRCHRGYCK
ncbi:MAG TPA: C25 family cysteine peptidase [Phycisphaerae bacterium]|nr:C25 family cysteine peptidase [Phycisphaerae bacterium]